MKSIMKYVAIMLTVVLTLGIFGVATSRADEQDNYKIEYTYENGKLVKYVIDRSGGVIEVIIVTSN